EEFASAQTDFLSFALFIGISMSITAFPVLARIVQEKGLSKTHLGQISIACAAFDDITAWSILAAVIAIAKTGSFISSLYTVGFAILFILIMLGVVKPFMQKIGKIYSNTETLNRNIIAFVFLLLTVSAFVTQTIGIHALFGAFLAGVIMPSRPEFRKIVIDKIEDVALTLLLPLFFVYTGLRTEIGLLNTPYLWMITGIVVALAIIGKFVGGAITAKIMGENWRDSLSLGILMNTRGLMEIVVLNIGYEMGILPGPIFVMLVIMALITTFMTTPILSLIQKIFPDKRMHENQLQEKAHGDFNALIAIGNPENGKALLNVARFALDGFKNTLKVKALHITPGSNTNPIYSDDLERESFKHIRNEAKLLNITLQTEHKFVDNIEAGVIKSCHTEEVDFLLVGAGISLSGIIYQGKTKPFSSIVWLNSMLTNLNKSTEIFYPGTLIKDKTKYFVENAPCSVGIFINRNFSGITEVLVLIQDEKDDFLIRYALRLLKNDPAVHITIIDEEKRLQSTIDFQASFQLLISTFPNSVKIIRTSRNNYSHFGKFNLMLVSYPVWNQLTHNNSSKLENIPSTLIINKKTSRFSKDKDKF
ncbi:MAG: cation:proton antiporter, partial [Ignavibacteria bacterium]|nr:cation:proton antiporter [Ignavibacteria bacterium]